MKKANTNIREVFFDSIADERDKSENLAAVAKTVDIGLAELGVANKEFVLDIGCGTGNLTLAILRRLSAAGRVLAIDISGRMLEKARVKTSDPRVEWRHASVEEGIAVKCGTVDRIICFSAWPHITNKAVAVTEFYRVLRKGGMLHIWHSIPRKKVNHIHRNSHLSIRKDLLAPGTETAALLEKFGFKVVEVIDDATRCRVTVNKAV